MPQEQDPLFSAIITSMSIAFWKVGFSNRGGLKNEWGKWWGAKGSLIIGSLIGSLNILFLLKIIIIGSFFSWC